MEGTANKATAALAKGSVALECFGLSKVRFAGCLSVSEQGAQVPKGTALGCRAIGLSRFLKGTDHTNQFLGSMGNGNIVVLALSAFLGQISSKGRIPVADILGRIEQGISQVSGTTLFHVRISVIQFA